MSEKVKPLTPGPYFHNQYSVYINSDGTILVDKGDTISAYCAAIYKKPVGRTKEHWLEFGRVGVLGEYSRLLANAHQIKTGELICHIATFKAKRPETPLDSRFAKIVGLIPRAQRLTKCLCYKLEKLIKLKGATGTRDSYFRWQHALKSAEIGYRSRKFDYKLALENMDRKSSHIFPALKRWNIDRSMSDEEFALELSNLSGQIQWNVDKLSSAFSGTKTHGSPHLSVVEEWFDTQTKDESSVLSCYRRVFRK